LKDHLGVGHDETTDDGAVTLEHVECNAACDYAPVMMVNWEFFDNQTPESAKQLVDDLRAGAEVTPTRGGPLRTFKEVERVLAGFPDGLANEGGSGGPATFVGLEIARERGEAAPEPPARGKATGSDPAPSEGSGYGAAGGPSGSDAPATTSKSDSAAPEKGAKDS
jgi:NADH-quinone oxidoreductase subunit E